jgi:ubiquinone/menaquinone biosynthesis C-methylase UbiE
LPELRRPEWQLPPGVPRGVWQYTQAQHIADQYDDEFALNRLFEFDEQILARHCVPPGLVVDLGCGTGRAVLLLARRGLRTVAVDLSPHMLQVVGEKAAMENLRVGRLRANMVQLDCLRNESADYVVCLFSTLGMIRGRDNRRRALGHAWRILRPGGLLVIHVHNFWYNLLSGAGRAWLARHLLEAAVRRDVERGDKFFDYSGIAKMFLHTFSRREFVRALVEARFTIKELIPLHTSRYRRLPWPWWFGGIRANGWIAVCWKEGG